MDDTYLRGCVFYSYLPEDGYNFCSLEGIEKEQWYQDYQTARNEGKIESGLYISYEPGPESTGTKTVYRMNMIQPINSFHTGYIEGREEQLCYQVLTLSLQGIVGDHSLNNGMSVHIFDAENQEMIYSDNIGLEKDARAALDHVGEERKSYNNFSQFSVRQSEKPLCVFYMESMGAYAVSVFDPVKNTGMRQPGWIALLLIMVIYMHLTIWLVFFYRRFRRRIEEVVGFLDRVNVSSAAPAAGVRKPDEIMRIERHIDQMQDRISNLVKEEYELKLQKVSAQYEALTACINPHFLYNTLNSIAVMASMEEAQDTEAMVIALSDMFRYSTDSHTRYVRWKDELKNISDYLYLQGIRYRDTFCYRVESEEGLEECLVPKLLLQPLVENCFKHGFARAARGKKNEIVIRAVREKKIVRISVIDNGAGFSKERLEEVNGQLRNKEYTPMGADASIGLVNVNRRLQILYGDEYGVTVSCEQGRYTVIEATMVYRGKENV